jgi:type IV pilus assembly protein PilM
MAEEQSIWKKEISFGRKRKDPAPEQSEATEAGDAPSGDEPTSLWKKELSFGRKKKDAPPAPDPQPVVEEPVVDEPVAEEPGAEEQVWTRAVSFGRSAQPEAVEQEEQPVAAGPEPVIEEPAEEEQVWTGAVSFGRTAEPQTVEDEPVADVEPEPEPVAEEPVADEQVWTRAVSFGRTAEPEPEPVVEAVPVVEAEPVVAAEPVPVVEVDEPEPVVGAEPTAALSAAPSLPPEAVVPPLSEVPVAAPVPMPEPEPGIHAPVTAEELPPLPEEKAEKKVPFWKKDISLGGGKKKEPKAKQPKQPKQPKEKKQKEPKAEKAPKAPKAPKAKVPRGSKGAKRLVGLKIGASQVAAARVANNGSAELLQVAREPLEPGIVVGGELRDPDALAEALKAFFAKHNLPKKGVRLGIANNRIGVRTFEVAGIGDQKQLANAIRFRAQEALPIPIDEAVLDFQVLGEGVDEQGQPTKRILLVVAYRELIDRYLDACKKAGIALVGIDLEAFALLRALQAPSAGDEGEPDSALVAVAVGHDRSTFAVSDGRVCEFTRVLEWGGAALNVAIARALDAAPSEVDDVKRALALTDEMVPDGLTADQAKMARDAMRRAIQTFARELVSSLQYYQNQPGSLGIGEIVLTGGTAHLHGLAGELEKLIGVRVRVGDPLARMKVSKKLGETDQVGSLAVAIGLGIED